MARNYGERLSARNWAAIIGGGAAVAIIVAAVLIIWRSSTQTDTQEATAWSPAGPPCPAISAADWKALAIEKPLPFGYESLKGEVENLDVSCNVIDRDGGKPTPPFPVCQFRAPFAIHVATAKGDAYFKPGVGQPATVSLPGGVARCVMAAPDMAG